MLRHWVNSCLRWFRSLTVAGVLRYAAQLSLVLLFGIGLALRRYSPDNAASAYPKEVLVLVAANVLTALLVFSLAYTVLKTTWARLAASVVLILALGRYFPLVESFVKPFFGDSMIVTSLIATVGAVWLVLYLARKSEPRVRRRPDLQQALTTGLQAICLIVFAYQSLNFIKILHQNAVAFAYRPPQMYHDLKITKHPSADIYYLVFDDYDSAPSLQKYLGFDNSSIMKFLHDQGFAVRQDAFANFQETAPSVASTLSMDYNIDIATKLKDFKGSNTTPYQAVIRDPPVNALMRKAGYDTVLFGSWWTPTRNQKDSVVPLPEAGITVFDHTFIPSELESGVLESKFFWPWLERGLTVNGHVIIKAGEAGARNQFLAQADALKKFAVTKHDRPQFVFAHLLNPHVPFSFEPDGDSPNYDQEPNNNGLPEDQKYTNQLQYTNKVIRELVTTIKKQSKQPPLIILQSDEGQEFVDDPEPSVTSSSDVLKKKFGTLAAYYLPGLSSEQTAKLDSSVNAFRLVFNEYFGANLSYLPDCSYVYDPDKQSFQYRDITGKLHVADPQCGKLIP